LQPHDLITGINGHIVSSGEALHRMIRDTGAGVQVTLSVFRNGNPITIRAKLANHEDVERKAWAQLNQPAAAPQLQHMEVSGANALGPTVAPAPTPAPAPASAAPAPHTQGFIDSMLHGPFTGLAVETCTPQLGSYFGAPNGQGLLVESVQDGSPGAVAGVHAGDVILRADSQPVHSASDWTKHLHAAKGKPIALDLLRDHQQMTVTMQPSSKK
jgi:S1-C subfamily serine protease